MGRSPAASYGGYWRVRVRSLLKIEIIAAGRLKKGPEYELCQEYIKRLHWSLTIHEIESKHTDPGKINAEEQEKIAKHLQGDSFIIALDEHGKGLRSMAFAKTIETLRNNGHTRLRFIIGGADGLSDEIRQKADIVLSMGAQTWPHMLARVMLLEQIYRAQQILNGHPYHRE